MKEGLQECVALLAPQEPGSTLALSSLRSESVKGFVTRVGTRIVKGVSGLLFCVANGMDALYKMFDCCTACVLFSFFWKIAHCAACTFLTNQRRYLYLKTKPLQSSPTNGNQIASPQSSRKPQDINLRLATLPPPRSLPSYPIRLSNPLPLPQLAHLLTLLNQSLDIIDISAWTGDPQNGSFIAGQLKLLADTLDEARQTLKGGEDVNGGKWWEPASDETAFSTLFPENLSFHLSIADAALLLHVRTLGPPSAPESSLTGLSIRTRLGLSPRPPPHDEVDQVFRYRGEEVVVKEKVRVESQDPSLMAVMAKLSALGHSVASWRLRVSVVMGEEVELE